MAIGKEKGNPANGRVPFFLDNQPCGSKKQEKRIQKIPNFISKRSVTFEPLDGFSNFKRLNDLEFCQQLIEITAEIVLAKTEEIGANEN